jgi:drug/metabolite transporter (DMT)-like permease
VGIFSVFLFKEKLDLPKIMAIILTIIGCVFVVGAYDVHNIKLNMVGVFAGLGAGLTYAMWSVLTKKGLSSYNLWTINTYGALIGAISLLLYQNPVKVFTMHVSWKIIGLIYLLAFMNAFLATTIYVVALKYIDAVKANIIANLEPVIAVTLAALVLHEKITPYNLFGFLMIMGAIYILAYKDILKEKRDKAKMNIGLEE